jgi:NAD(P)-dependent dehydrogenase (short-subunit alcohol dehydrogenase family)
MSEANPSASSPARPVMVITGGSRGIGAAIARAAASGYDLVINYASDERAASDVVARAMATGARAIAVRADIGSEIEVVEMFAQVDRVFGRLDVLVNNAGIAGGYGALATVTSDALNQLWAVNVTGAFICAREAAARMATDSGGRGGSIVNISSRAAVLGGPTEWVHYAASKGAIDTMTIGLSKELAAAGIRVNAVRPGLIESDFHLHATPGRLERIAPTVPMQRAGSPDEVAAAVLWLASAEASYVTGAFIDVSGGR